MVLVNSRLAIVKIQENQQMNKMKIKFQVPVADIREGDLEPLIYVQYIIVSCSCSCSCSNPKQALDQFRKAKMSLLVTKKKFRQSNSLTPFLNCTLFYYNLHFSIIIIIIIKNLLQYYLQSKYSQTPLRNQGLNWIKFKILILITQN